MSQEEPRPQTARSAGSCSRFGRVLEQIESAMLKAEANPWGGSLEIPVTRSVEEQAS
jgi:hypothetical protein